MRVPPSRHDLARNEPKPDIQNMDRDEAARTRSRNWRCPLCLLEGSRYANGGMDFPRSRFSRTWAKHQREWRSTELTTTEGMNPATADGLTARPRSGIVVSAKFVELRREALFHQGELPGLEPE